MEILLKSHKKIEIIILILKLHLFENWNKTKQNKNQEIHLMKRNGMSKRTAKSMWWMTMSMIMTFVLVMPFFTCSVAGFFGLKMVIIFATTAIVEKLFAFATCMIVVPALHWSHTPYSAFGWNKQSLIAWVRAIIFVYLKNSINIHL